MRILFYIPETSQAYGGVRQYIIMILHLMSKSRENDFFILNIDSDPEIKQIIDDSECLHLIPKQIAVERKYEKLVFNFFRTINFIGLHYNLKLKFRKWSYVQRICNKFNIDIVHSPYNAPYCKTDVIWTLHDCQELHFPDYFTPLERSQRAWARLDSFKVSSRVIVSYEHVKNDVIKYFFVAEDDIAVLPINMSRSWVLNINRKNPGKGVGMILPQKFLFYPANIWEHKNHLAILKAMKILSEKGMTDIHVVFTGVKTSYYEQLEQFIIENNLQLNVTHFGVVDQGEMLAIYDHAWAVVIPTKYEAGSFPLMESILLEVPVICSNVTSLPSTIKNEKYIFEPDDYQRLSILMRELWCNESFRNENRKHLKNIKSGLLDVDSTKTLDGLYTSIKYHLSFLKSECNNNSDLN